jgi:hypothetical protein
MVAQGKGGREDQADFAVISDQSVFRRKSKSRFRRTFLDVLFGIQLLYIIVIFFVLRGARHGL